MDMARTFTDVCRFNDATFAARRAARAPAAAAAADVSSAVAAPETPFGAVVELLSRFQEVSWNPRYIPLTPRESDLVEDLYGSLEEFYTPLVWVPVARGAFGEIFVFRHDATGYTSIQKRCICDTPAKKFSTFMEIFIQINAALMRSPLYAVAPLIASVSRLTARNELCWDMENVGTSLCKRLVAKAQTLTLDPTDFGHIVGGLDFLLRTQCGGRLRHRDLHAGNVVYRDVLGVVNFREPILIDFGKALLDERYHTNDPDGMYRSDSDIYTICTYLLSTLLKYKAVAPTPPVRAHVEVCEHAMRGFIVAHVPDFAARMIYLNAAGTECCDWESTYGMIYALENSCATAAISDADLVSQYDFCNRVFSTMATTRYTGFPTLETLHAILIAARAARGGGGASAVPRRKPRRQRGGSAREVESMGRHGTLAIGLMYYERSTYSFDDTGRKFFDLTLHDLEAFEDKRHAHIPVTSNESRRNSRSRSRSNRSSRNSRTRRHRRSV